MANDYFLEMKQIVDGLSNDEEFILEEKLIVLELMASYIAKIENELERGLAPESGDQHS